MATTTNFGWETPDDTDLVKDGAAAMRTLGNSIDTSFVDLKGGTTGQVLSKNSNTDLDFTWVAQDDSNAIQNAIVDAKGDLIAASAADTPARLAVGTNGQVLTADSTASTGLAWSTPTSGGWTQISSGSLSGNVYTISSIPSTYKDLRFVMMNGSSSGGGVLFLRLNGDSATNYYYTTINSTQNTSYVNGNSNVQGILDFNGISAGQGLIFEIYEYASTNIRKLYNEWQWNKTNYDAKIGGYNSASAITSLSVQPQSSNWSAGTWQLWGLK